MQIEHRCRIEAVRLKVGPGIVRDKTGYAKFLKIEEMVLDFGIIGARENGLAHVPELVGFLAAQFEVHLRSVRNRQAVKWWHREMDESRVAPIVEIARDIFFEKVGVQNVHVIQTDDLGVDLVAGRSQVAENQRARFVALLKDDGGLGIEEAEVLINRAVFLQYLRRDVRFGRQNCGSLQEACHSFGARGIRQRFDELPGAVGKFRADFQLFGQLNLDARHRVGLKIGTHQFGAGSGFVLVPFKNQMKANNPPVINTNSKVFFGFMAVRRDRSMPTLEPDKAAEE